MKLSCGHHLKWSSIAFRGSLSPGLASCWAGDIRLTDLLPGVEPSSKECWFVASRLRHVLTKGQVMKIVRLLLVLVAPPATYLATQPVGLGFDCAWESIDFTVG